MSPHPVATDPFASTADPDAYVPRPAAESLLAHLTEQLDDGHRILVLTGPPGIGKTMLMNVLARRIEDRFRTLYLPYASMEFSELCHWMLGLLGESPDAHPDAVHAFLANARRVGAAGRPTLLLVDDASTMPAATARALAALVHESAGAIRVLLVPAEDLRTAPLLAAFEPEAPELRLAAPFGRAESAHFVQSRLERAQVPGDLTERFTPEVLGLLHRLSGGVPRLLNHLADEVLRGRLDTLRVGTSEEAPAEAAAEPASDAPEAAGPAEAPLEAGEPKPGDGPDAAAPTEPEPPAPRLASPADPEALRSPPPELVTITSSEASPKRMGLVIAINLALAAGTLALLWATGYFPPPVH